MDSTLYSAADVLLSYLIDEGICKEELTDDDSIEWNGYVDAKPPKGKRVIVLQDSTGILDRRSMRTGRMHHHPGVEIMIVCDDYRTGWRKLKEIVHHLNENVNRSFVQHDNTMLFRIDSLSQRSDLIPLGPEPDGQREMFSVNYTATITRVEETNFDLFDLLNLWAPFHEVA